MRKKFLSYLAIFSLIMGLFVMGQTNTIYADNTKLNPDDMESILNDISSVGKAWESMGFQSQDISEIMQLPRKNSNFYKGIEASVNELSNASKETKKIENTLMKQETITLYSQDGNPPSGVEEQNERIKYVTQVALDRYGSVYNSEQFNKYVVYLYMSHYIDNPNYTRENPGFDNIYAYVITNDDIRAYDKFIEQTKYSMFSENVVNFINDYKSAVDNIVGLTGSIADSKIVSFNTLNSIYGLKDFNPNKMVTRAAMIAESFNKNYENAVTGETFRRVGKTDIQIQRDDKAAFIAECKVWHGIKLFSDAIDQLFCYATWKDTKLSLVVFNKDNKNFAGIQQQVQNWIKENCKSYKQWNSNIWDCVKYREDTGRDVRLAIALYDVSIKELPSSKKN